MAIEILDEQRARQLTDRIRQAADDLWALLLEAHTGRAWESLGYANWESYVRAEFAMSRRHSYRLLDQATVVREIEAAAGVPHVAQLTHRDVEDLKPHLEVVKDAIKEATRGIPEDKIAEAVAETIKSERERIIRERQEIAELNAEHDPGPEFDWVRDEELIRQEGAIRRIAAELCRFPPPEQFAKDHADLDLDTIRAVRTCWIWLDNFLNAWEGR